jgi:hypothetical protein
MSGGVGSEPGPAAPPPPLAEPPGTAGGVRLGSGDVEGAGLLVLVTPPRLPLGSGVGAGVAVCPGGGGSPTGGGPLDCSPGIGVDGGDVDQLRSGEDGGALETSVGLGSLLSVQLGVGDCSVVDGADAELDGVSVSGGRDDGALVGDSLGGGSLGGGTVESVVDDGGSFVAVGSPVAVGSLVEGGAVVDGVSLDEPGAVVECSGGDG